MCPKCGGVNVTSVLDRRGKWECMDARCRTVFDRDQQLRRLGLIR